MANFKNYSLKPDIAHFSLSLIGNLITFSDVVHKALVFCFLFIARCKHVHVFTVNKAISTIHRFRWIISTFQSGVPDLGHCCYLHPLVTYWLTDQLQYFCFQATSRSGTIRSSIFSHTIQKLRVSQTRLHFRSSASCMHLQQTKVVILNPLFPWCIFVSDILFTLFTLWLWFCVVSKRGGYILGLTIKEQ